MEKRIVLNQEDFNKRDSFKGVIDRIAAGELPQGRFVMGYLPGTKKPRKVLFDSDLIKPGNGERYYFANTSYPKAQTWYFSVIGSCLEDLERKREGKETEIFRLIEFVYNV